MKKESRCGGRPLSTRSTSDLSPNTRHPCDARPDSALVGLGHGEHPNRLGSSSPEMKIEGILQAEELRDYLYQKMRGAKGQVDEVPLGDQKLASTSEVTQLLTGIRDNLARWLNSKKVRDERSSVESFRVVLSRYLADRDRVVASP